MKIYLGVFLIIFLLCLAGWMINSSVNAISDRKKIAENVTKIPEFTLQKLESTFKVGRAEVLNSSLCLIYF